MVLLVHEGVYERAFFGIVDGQLGVRWGGRGGSRAGPNQMPLSDRSFDII